MPAEHFSHSSLYRYCHKLFETHIPSLENVHPAIATLSKHSLFYWYPATVSPLREIVSDTKLLSDMGWIPGFYNSPFLIWYRDSDNGIQCIPINLATASMIKNGPINADIPFSYRYVQTVVNKRAKKTEVYICSDPVIAAILISSGLMAIATGSDYLPEKHEKYLAGLNASLVFLASDKQPDACERFVKAMSKFPAPVNIAMTSDLLSLLQQDNIPMALSALIQPGDQFLIKRIANKRRNKTGLSIEEEFSRILSAANPETRSRLTHLLTGADPQIDSSYQYANACYFMAELLRANLRISEAERIVQERYKVKITLSFI